MSSKGDNALVTFVNMKKSRHKILLVDIEIKKGSIRLLVFIFWIFINV